MWALFVSFSFGAIDETVYQGNWTIINGSETDASVSRFRITLYPNTQKYNYSFLKCTIEFINEYGIYLNDVYDMTGIISEEEGTILCYRPQRGRSFSESCDYLKGLLDALNETMEDPVNLSSTVISSLQLRDKNFRYVAFGLFLSPGEVSGPFDLPVRVEGIYNIDNLVKVSLEGVLFNLKMFVAEGKIFGVAISIVIVFQFYAWLIIVKTFTTNTRRRRLSSHSFMMHISFDFSLAFVMFDVSLYTVHMLKLFSLLFGTTMTIYFLLQMQTLTLIWKANNDLDGDTHRLHLQVICFLTEMCVILTVTITASAYMFIAPIPSLLFLYSFWIPQIYHLCRNPVKDRNLAAFVILCTIGKDLLLAYFSFYGNNIMNKIGREVGLGFIIYFTVQSVIVALQCVFGGDFMVPRRFRSTGFSYTRSRPPYGTECPICMSQIEPEDRAMVTPCGHCFHRACLERWMEQELICPVCRARLPQEN